jgi:hypothetical protein
MDIKIVCAAVAGGTGVLGLVVREWAGGGVYWLGAAFSAWGRRGWRSCRGALKGPHPSPGGLPVTPHRAAAVDRPDLDPSAVPDGWVAAGDRQGGVQVGRFDDVELG